MSWCWCAWPDCPRRLGRSSAEARKASDSVTKKKVHKIEAQETDAQINGKLLIEDGCACITGPDGGALDALSLGVLDDFDGLDVVVQIRLADGADSE